MKTNIILNIGTQAFNKSHTRTSGVIVEACRASGLTLTQSEFRQSDTELTLVARAEYDGTDDLTATIYNLALALDQGCIAWLDAGGIGHLTGPQAEQWGAFNREFFLFPKVDTNDFCLRWETEELTLEEIKAGFQALIDSGAIRGLQGHYQRTAHELIQAGHCTQKGGTN